MAGVTLPRFLAAARRQHSSQDILGCCLLPADWVVASLARDPAAAWRGKRLDHIGAALMVHRRGGLQAVVAEGCLAAGLAAVTTFETGDVGLIRVMSEEGAVPAGAIFNDGRWVFRTPLGLAAAALEPICAWGVRWPQP